MSEVYKPVSKEEFENMLPSQQRVEIAKDVIAGLNAAKFEADSGTYFRLEVEPDHGTPSTRSLRSLLHWPNRYCKVCAIGACFVALVDKVNAYDLDDQSKGRPEVSLSYSADMREYLTRYFDHRQLRLMEAAFEGEDIDDTFSRYVAETDDYIVEEDCLAAQRFHGKYYEDSLRLIAIMENVIANGGEFKPEVVAE